MVKASGGAVLAAVERKKLEDLAGALQDGTLAFQMQQLSELPLTAIVVETRYSASTSSSTSMGVGWQVSWGRLGVRYPEVHPVFADFRRVADASGPGPDRWCV